MKAPACGASQSPARRHMRRAVVQSRWPARAAKHRNGAGAARDRLIEVFELVNVFDPAQLLLGEGRLVTHVHDDHGDRPWRVLLKNAATPAAILAE